MNTRVRLIAMRLVATLAILAGLVGSAVGQQVMLHDRWKKGDELSYRVVEQTTTTMSGLPGSGEVPVDTTVNHVLRTVVDDVAADGTATLHYVFHSARWEMKSPMGTIASDTVTSDSTAPNPLATVMNKVLSALVGQPFVVVMSPNGQVQKVEGMNTLMEKVFNTLPADPSVAAMLDGLKDSFSEESTRGALAQGYGQLPDRPLVPGDTWNSRWTATHPVVGRLTTTNVSTLKSVETVGTDSVATVTTNLTMTQDQPAPIGPTRLTMQSGSSGESEMIFDVARGRLRRSTSRATMPIGMSGRGPDGNAMNIHAVVKSLLTMELVQ